MNKKFCKLTVFALILTMCLSLAACKGKTDAEEVTGDVYVPTFKEYKSDADWVQEAFMQGKNPVIAAESYDEKLERYVMKLVKFDSDTGEKTEKVLDFGENTSLDRFISSNDAYYGILIKYEYPEGTFNEDITPYTETETSESGNDEDETASVDETMPAVDETISSVDIGKYDEEYVEPDMDYQVVKLDKDFNEVERIDINEFVNKIKEDTGWFYAERFCVDKEGNMIFALDQNLIILDKTGKITNEMQFDSWIQALVIGADGSIYTAYYDAEYNTVFAKVDIATGKLGEPLKNIPVQDINNPIPSDDGKIFFNSSNYLYSYDPVTETSETVLNWIDCDINSDLLRSIAVYEDGQIITLSSQTEYKEDKRETTVEVATINKVPANSVKQKTKISCAMLYLDYKMQEEIIKFNKTNENYRITVKIYMGDDYDYEEYEQIIKTFSSDVASGNAADIIILPSYNAPSIPNLVSKGVLADLSAMIEKDTEINESDFIPSVLDACRINGKVYTLFDSFMVNTFAVKSANVGDKKSWNFNDMVELMNKYPDAELIEYITKNSMLEMVLSSNMSSFIDEETGMCKFDSDEFVSLLEICNRLPKEYTWDEQRESTPSLLRGDKLLLYRVGVYDFSEIQMAEALFGEPVTYIGYPCADGKGSIISYNNAMCINAKSKNKEAAFEFIKHFFTKQYQTEEIDYWLPVRQDVLDERIEKACTPDENNSQIWDYDGVEIEVKELTKEQADNIRDIINRLAPISANDAELTKIVTEEAQAFFEGQKSASDVANIIQSRAQIYVDESR